MRKLILNVYIAANITLVIWFVVSWVDVVAHYSSGGTHAAWNLFNLLF